MTDRPYRRAADVLHSPVGDDVVALRVAGGRCFGMEDVTAEVWRQLDSPAGLDAICAALLDRYDVDPATCRAEVGQLLDQMVGAGLVERRG